MNRSELISAIVTASEVDKKTVEKVVDATFSQIVGTLAKGEEIRLVGFGSFKVSDRKARKGKNPRTGEAIDIPAAKAAVFKPGKELKDKLNG